MRGILLISCLAVLLGGITSGATARRRATPKCPRAHSHVVLANRQAELYEWEPISGLEIFGCTYARKRSYDLGGEPSSGATGGGGVNHLTMAGPIVAFREFSSSTFAEHPSGEDWVVVRDLRNGRVLHKIVSDTDPGAPRPTDAIVVKSNGAVAWIVEARSGPSYEVHAVDSLGSRLLASGPDIDPSSLALAGSTLYWTQGGKPASARLN